MGNRETGEGESRLRVDCGNPGVWAKTSVALRVNGMLCHNQDNTMRCHNVYFEVYILYEVYMCSLRGVNVVPETRRDKRSKPPALLSCRSYPNNIESTVTNNTRGWAYDVCPTFSGLTKKMFARYQNQPSLSNSGPLAAASRYGAKGTLRMIRREASALRGGRALNEGSFVEGLDVDEWSPMLRCSTSPSLATMTTPKVLILLLRTLVLLNLYCV